jgi:hypothetical protein
MKITHIICLIAPIAVSACGWIHGDLSEHIRFNAKDLIEGGMGIGGVVIADDDGGETAPGDLASRMRNAIVEARQDFKVVSSRSIVRYMGTEGYGALIETYRRNRTVQPEVLSEIAPDLEEHFRFLALAVIDRDTLSTRVKPRQRPGDSRPSTDYITTREVGATFDVYDLETLTRAWTVYLTASADRTLTRRQQEEAPVAPPSSPYPDPISLQEVAAFLFDEFAWRLPGYTPARVDSTADQRI